MANKIPAFQFYPADWRKDPAVQSLSYHDRGIWFEILCLMHESEQRGRLLLNGKKMPDEALARLLGLDKQILTKTLTKLLDYGVASRDEQGALMSRRMVRDETLRQIRTEAGKKGGNPNLVNQNSTKEKKLVNQNSTPSSSSSSSEPSSLSDDKKEGRQASPAREESPPADRPAVFLSDEEKKMTKKQFAEHLKTAFAHLEDVDFKTGECVAWYQRRFSRAPNRLEVKKWLSEEYEDVNADLSGKKQPDWKKAIDDCTLCDRRGMIETGNGMQKCKHEKL